jgi:hypothetical protein
MLPESQVCRRPYIRTEAAPQRRGMSVVEGARAIPFAIVHQWPYVRALSPLGEES